MKVIFLLCLTMMLSSCAGPLILNPRRCQGNGLWTEPVREPLKSHTKKVWTGVSGATLNLATVFEEAGYKCEDVGGLEVIVTQTTSDFFFSLIPFVSRKSVTLNFYPRPVIMEVTEIGTDN